MNVIAQRGFVILNKQRSSSYFITVSCFHTTTNEEHTFFPHYHPLRMQLYESFYPHAADDFLFHDIISRDDAYFMPAGAFTVHNPHERGFEVSCSFNAWNGTAGVGLKSVAASTHGMVGLVS
jgi:hypothetical protein